MYRIACIIVTPDEMEVYLSIALYPYVMHTKQKSDIIADAASCFCPIAILLFAL